MFACLCACDELTASLWRVDRVTSWPGDELTCDELTVWRVDRMTSWPCDELTDSRFSLRPSFFFCFALFAFTNMWSCWAVILFGVLYLAIELSALQITSWVEMSWGPWAVHITLTNRCADGVTFLMPILTEPRSLRSTKSTSMSRCKWVTIHSSGLQNEFGSISLNPTILREVLALLHSLSLYSVTNFTAFVDIIP